MTTEKIVAGLAIIAGGITAVGTIYKKVLRPMWVKVKNVNTLLDLMVGVKTLLAEMKPNGGSTIRDSIDRIEKNSMETRNAVNRAEARTIARQAVMNDLAPFGIFDTAENGEVNYLNRTFSVWTGRPAGELMGYGWTNMIPPRERRSVIEAWNEALDEKRVFETQFNLVDQNGKEFAVSCRATPVKSHIDGTIFGYRGIIQRIDTNGSNSGMPALN